MKDMLILSFKSSLFSLSLFQTVKSPAIIVFYSPCALESVPPGLPGRGLVQVGDEEAAQLHSGARDQGLDEQLLS